MEVSPRAGGNRLAEMLNYAADVDIIEAEVLKAVSEGIPAISEPTYSGFCAIQVLHSECSGVFDSIVVDEAFAHQHLIEKELRVKPGDSVRAFSGANDAIGTLFLRFDNRPQMKYTLSHLRDWLQVVVKESI